MQSISTTHPLQLLKELEQSCKKLLSIPMEKTPEKSHWSGLGIRLNEINLCIHSNEIDEVIDSHFYQNLSQVPGAKNWLSGLISLRGQALPVIDLKQYVFNKKSIPTKKSRLLVIKLSNTRTGLIIEETYGLKRFNISSSNPPQSISAELSKFSSQVFFDDKQFWVEFSVSKLENDPDFLNAARF